ncbi:MAG: glycosyltransferase family 39 protein [Ignavibacteria bacterium]|nr:glycosyltransferase family 39 protein [Ignavibacteria bacterium]
MSGNYKKKIYILAGSSLLISVSVYILFNFIQPAHVLSVLKINFNSPDKINILVSKQLGILILLLSAALVLFWLYHSKYYTPFTEHLRGVIKSFSQKLTPLILFLFSAVYLSILFYFSITHYDLGYDEAWYIHWTKNFSNTGIAFYTTDGKVSIIDTITMLPYYLLAPFMFWSGLNDVWQFKLFCSILSVTALAVLFIFVKNASGRTTAIFALFFLILQPGFGFIASSYFGELFQVMFLLGGVYFWLLKVNQDKKKDIMISALFFSLAIHTKFQLLIILFLTFVIFAITDKNSRAPRILLFTVLFTAAIGILRIIPVLIDDPKNVRYLLIMDWVSGNSIAQSLSFTAFEKLQLFNRFFPLTLFSIIIISSFIYLKKPFERFLTVYSVVAVLWWIFLFPYTTYRHPFIGIISLCILAGILSVKFYTYFSGSVGVNRYLLKYLTVIVVALLMSYGFSANLIYAYIGYNDGVQFDLDGFKNRLFSPILRDNSQKEFYAQLKQSLNKTDTIYNPSFVSRFYLENPVFTLNTMYSNFNDTLKSTHNEKLMLITRENYPMGFDRIYKEIDSLGYKKRLLRKHGDFELYGISKENN